MVKNSTTNTPSSQTPPAIPPALPADDASLAQFKKGLEASCLESLQRSHRNGPGNYRFMTAENWLGVLLFALVWLAGGAFRFLLVPGETWKVRFFDLDFLLFLLVLAGFQVFFLLALNAPWKAVRNIPKLKKYLLISLTVILEFAAVFGIVKIQAIPTDTPWQFLTVVPLAIVPALLVNLLDERTAACTAILEAMLLPLQIPDYADNYRIFCYALFIAMIAVPCFRNIRFRIHYISYGLLQGILAVLAALLFYFTTKGNNVPFTWPLRIRQSALPGVAQGFLTGVGCLLLLPLLEAAFHIPTPLTLAEMTDVNAPLLQRLRNEAPGTYQHSLDVAEMATNAASQIGADAKLVNVMGLYHDVGKLFAPQFFAENMTPGQNPLENNIRPEESANIIFEHITHGVQLANKYHLSSLILPAIRQHHGKTMLEHFYRKACEQAEAAKTPPPMPENFRYPQKPTSSREVAILSLADSCEAAVRALLSAKPDLNQLSQKILAETKDAGASAASKCADILNRTLYAKEQSEVIKSIDDRIASVFKSRFTDHQLDNVDLTIKELATLARSFRETILFHFHTRPEYRTK